MAAKKNEREEFDFNNIIENHNEVNFPTDKTKHDILSIFGNKREFELIENEEGPLNLQLFLYLTDITNIKLKPKDLFSIILDYLPNNKLNYLKENLLINDIIKINNYLEKEFLYNKIEDKYADFLWDAKFLVSKMSETEKLSWISGLSMENQVMITFTEQEYRKYASMKKQAEMLSAMINPREYNGVVPLSQEITSKLVIRLKRMEDELQRMENFALIISVEEKVKLLTQRIEGFMKPIRSEFNIYFSSVGTKIKGMSDSQLQEYVGSMDIQDLVMLVTTEKEFKDYIKAKENYSKFELRNGTKENRGIKPQSKNISSRSVIVQTRLEETIDSMESFARSIPLNELTNMLKLKVKKYSDKK